LCFGLIKILMLGRGCFPAAGVSISEDRLIAGVAAQGVSFRAALTVFSQSAARQQKTLL